MSKKKKLAKEILDKLKFESAPLSNNKGRVDRTPRMKPNRKDRRHSGRTTTFVDDEDYPVLYQWYDDWRNYRDSQRDKSKIVKHIYPQMFWHDEEQYWDKREEIEKIRKKEKIRRMKNEKKLLWK